MWLFSLGEPAFWRIDIHYPNISPLPIVLILQCRSFAHFSGSRNAWSSSGLVNFTCGMKLNPTQPPLPLDPQFL